MLPIVDELRRAHVIGDSLQLSNSAARTVTELREPRHVHKQVRFELM